MVEESGVENLTDAGHRRFPGPNLIAHRWNSHAKIVQDRPSAAAIRLFRGNRSQVFPTEVSRSRVGMSDLAALAMFALVSSVTPGPNNAMLWASGAQFGFRPTLPHVVGTSVGIGTMAIAVAAGLGALVTTVPQVEIALKAVGSFYLLYLAYQVVGSGAVRRAEVARPLRLGQATAFQYVNPKAWVFVVAAIGTFRPAAFPVVVASISMAVTMMLVVIPTAAVWAVGGNVLNRFITSERAHRALAVVLAFLLAGTVAYIWI